jgi:hypothetical protein
VPHVSENPQFGLSLQPRCLSELVVGDETGIHFSEPLLDRLRTRDPAALVARSDPAPHANDEPLDQHCRFHIACTSPRDALDGMGSIRRSMCVTERPAICLPVAKSHLHFGGIKARDHRHHALKMDALCQMATDNYPVCRLSLTVFPPV